MDPVSKILFAERVRLSNAIRREIAALGMIQKDIRQSIQKADIEDVKALEYIDNQVNRLDLVLGGLSNIAKAQNVLISQTPEAKFVKKDFDNHKPDDTK